MTTQSKWNSILLGFSEEPWRMCLRLLTYRQEDWSISPPTPMSYYLRFVTKVLISLLVSLMIWLWKKFQRCKTKRLSGNVWYGTLCMNLPVPLCWNEAAGGEKTWGSTRAFRAADLTVLSRTKPAFRHLHFNFILITRNIIILVDHEKQINGLAILSFLAMKTK